MSHLPVDGLSDDPPDVCLIEVGGTVGDIESLVFLEALRQVRSVFRKQRHTWEILNCRRCAHATPSCKCAGMLALPHAPTSFYHVRENRLPMRMTRVLQFAGRVGHDNIMFVHVSLVPVLGSVGEQKTKPTQHSVKELRSVGVAPDVVICRSARTLERGTRDKLALFCQVPPENVLTVHDVPNIYHVPMLLHEQGAAAIVSSRLRLPLPQAPEVALGAWRALADTVDSVRAQVRIALVGKYTGLQDSYLSVIKALQVCFPCQDCGAVWFALSRRLSNRNRLASPRTAAHRPRLSCHAIRRTNAACCDYR